MNASWSAEATRDRFWYAHSDANRAHNARALFADYLHAQAVPDTDFYGAELVFGELVGNVVRHAPGPLVVSLRWIDGGAFLEVFDEGLGYDLETSLPDGLSETHRGLFLVAALGHDLRVEQRGQQVVTSVKLPIARSCEPVDAAPHAGARGIS